MNHKANLKIWIGALGILTLMGFGALGYQLVHGLGVTGMNNAVSWGTYITMFMFFVGLSTGGLIVSSSATVFNISAFKVVAKLATILATVCIVVAGIFIMVDIGGPERILNLLLHPNLKSPLLWDVYVISLYLVINILYLYFMTRPNPNPKMMKIVPSIALPVAILVQSVEAWLFGLQIARAGWYSALMAPLFVASALDSGLAFPIIVLVLLKKYKLFTVEKKLITSFAGLLVTFVAVDAYFVFSEVLTMLYPQEESEMLVLKEMVKGSTAPYFWGEVILGFVIPLAILLFKKNRQNTRLVIFSSVFIVIGVFFKRVWLLFTSFIYQNTDGAPGITLGKFIPSDNPAAFPNIWLRHGHYAPTLIEIMIVVGMISFGTLLFIVLSRKILLGQSTKATQSPQQSVEKSAALHG